MGCGSGWVGSLDAGVPYGVYEVDGAYGVYGVEGVDGVERWIAWMVWTS